MWSGVTANAGGVAGLYDITLADPSGGEGPIKYDSQFLPADITFDDPDTEEPETLPKFHLEWTTGSLFVAPILATFAATQKVRIQSSTAPPAQSLLPAGYKHKVRIVADGTPTENLSIDRPDMISKYGVRVATLDRRISPVPTTGFPTRLRRTGRAPARCRPAGRTALLQIVAARDFWGHTECVISGVQLTVSSEQLPLFDGNGGVKLHQAANSRIALYGAPAPVVTVNTVDLAYADGLRFPFPQFQLGAPITIEDPDTDVSGGHAVRGRDPRLDQPDDAQHRALQ
jgi:hypothetical protein